MKKFVDIVISLFINWLGCLKVCLPSLGAHFFEFGRLISLKCLNLYTFR